MFREKDEEGNSMETCDTTLDLMFERAVEKQWEEENPPALADPIASLSVETRISAFADLATTRYMLKLCIEDIGEACDKVKNTPQGDKLAGMYDQLSDFTYELKKIEREIWRSKENE